MGHSTVSRKRLSAGVLSLDEADATAVLRLVEALRDRSPREAVEFISFSAVNGRRPEALVSRLPSDTRTLARKNNEGVLALRSMLLADTISTEETRSALGLTRQAVAERVKRKELFAIRDGRSFRFPRWQFNDEQASGVVHGLSKILRAAKHLTDIEILSWFVRPQPSMGGVKPADALRDGAVDLVIRAIEAVGVT